MKPSPLILSIVLSILVITGINQAQAHAFLDKSDPGVGSQLSKAPTQVKIWFTEKLEPAFSSITVCDSSGKQIDKKDSHVDPSNEAILMVSVSSLPPGTYKVSWKVVAEDTHHTQGSFSFVVK